MTEQSFTVFVVDDDAAVRRALKISLEHAGYTVATFGCAEDFLEQLPGDGYGCIVLDVRMPGIEGPELQEHLAREDIDLPIIFVTGHASVPLSVRAIKSGAVDFLEKPFSRHVLLERIAEARQELDSERTRRRLHAEVRQRLRKLTNRELEVANLLVRSKPVVSSKDIGAELAISPRTAEQHRASILAKMEVASVTELCMMLAGAGVRVPDTPTVSAPARET